MRFYSLIAHQQPEAGHAFVCQELLDKSEVTRTHLESHNKRLNLGLLLQPRNYTFS